MVVNLIPHLNIQWTAHLSKCTTNLPDGIFRGNRIRKIESFAFETNAFLRRMEKEEEKKTTIKQKPLKIDVYKSEAWYFCMTPQWLTFPFKNNNNWFRKNAIHLASYVFFLFSVMDWCAEEEMIINFVGFLCKHKSICL